jgi:hypothetical protein
MCEKDKNCGPYSGMEDNLHEAYAISSYIPSKIYILYYNNPYKNIFVMVIWLLGFASIEQYYVAWSYV